MVPLVGGAGVELFQAVVNSGREARMQAWIADVTQAINERVLEPRGLDISALATDDGFLDVIGTATRAAVETSSEEKIEALRNAVVNATCAPDTERDRHAILIGIVSSLTPTHIKLLTLFDDPNGWFARASVPTPNVYMGGAYIVVEAAYPDLAADSTLLSRVIADLSRDGLSDIPLKTMMTSNGVFARRTQPLGEELLRFISA